MSAAAGLPGVALNGTQSAPAKNEETAMADDLSIPLLDHELAEDELRWMRSVYEDFGTERAKSPGSDPKEALRSVLGRAEYALTDPAALTRDGPWRLGKNSHGRGVAAVFLKSVELHRHPRSRTDQFAMYVAGGAADGYSEDDHGQPVLTAVNGGDHFHNPPGAPHAFLPRVGEPAGDDWEIAFIAITPRNLREDTHSVSGETKMSYQRVSGREAPIHV
jgi:hypothetical protein